MRNRGLTGVILPIPFRLSFMEIFESSVFHANSLAVNFSINSYSSVNPENRDLTEN